MEINVKHQLDPTPLTEKVKRKFSVGKEKKFLIIVDQEAKEQEVIIYEFHFPMDLCGRLIGRQGVHVDYIRQKTQVDLVVRDDSVPSDKQVVALHGSIRSSDEKTLSHPLRSGRRVDVEQAIELIARRFPPARYSQVTFKPVNKKIILRQRDPERVPIPPAAAQVKLFSSPL